MNPPSGPPVKCGYCGWLIQGCQNIIQHKCLEHYDEHKHYLHVDDEFVVTLITRSDAMQDPATEQVHNDCSESDELLIKAVFARPGLYNTKLPVKERSKLKIKGLWLEVSNTLGRTIDDVKKRWQYLRDCFIKEKNKQQRYTPSGSAAGQVKKPSFRLYHQMLFLCDSLPSIQTVSNIHPPQSPEDSGCSSLSPNMSVGWSTVLPGPSSASSSINSLNEDHDSFSSPTPPPRTPTPGGKKRKVDDSNADIRGALLTAFQQPVPQADAVDGILARLGEGLRRIPYRERAILEIKFLSLLLEAEQSCGLP